MFTPQPVQRFSAHATALGKVLLAGAGKERIDRFIGCRLALERFSAYTITSPEVLREELENVLHLGYAVSTEEARCGCRCIGVPVRSSSGSVVAALSVSNTTRYFTDDRFGFLLSKLEPSARIIERWL